MQVHLVGGLIYALDFDRIRSTLSSPGISNVSPTCSTASDAVNKQSVNRPTTD